MEFIVGTAGHIDHGKTALVKALTGTDADRLPEEKRRGITVDLGFAEMTVGETHFGFVDVPGHDKFVRNMLAGASGIDVVLLVVAADEGVMPQTREHFDICRLLDIKAGVIALTKADLVDTDTLALAKTDVAELVTGSFLDGAPVIPVSSKTGSGVDELKRALMTGAVSSEQLDDPFIARLPIDRSFTIKGFGTVVTGTLHSGKINSTTQMELLPDHRPVRIRGLETHGSSTQVAIAGQRVAVNLSNIDSSDVERGMLLAEAGALRATQVIDVEIEILKTAPRALRSRSRVRVHLGTAEVLARVRVLKESGEIAPGETGFAQLRLEAPTAALPGERFIIRSYSPQITVAGGIVLDNSAERHRRRDFALVHEQLTARLDTLGRPINLITLLIEIAGQSGLSADDLQERTGYRRGIIDTALRDLAHKCIRTGDRIVATETFQELKRSAIQTLTSAHQRDPLSKGISRQALAEAAFRNVPAAIVDSVIDSLHREALLSTDAETVRLASHAAKLSPDEDLFTDQLLSVYKRAGLEVPKLSEAVHRSAEGIKLTSQTMQKLVRLTLDDGRIVKVTDEFYFHAAAIVALTKLMREKLTAEFDVAAFKELAGVSRKYAIPLLEYFDRMHVTARVGDRRVIIE